MGGRILILCFLAYFNCISETGAIDLDYYMSYLRTVNCNTKQGEEDCRANCRNGFFMCHRGQCYCEDIPTTLQMKQQKPKTNNPSLNEMIVRPALRHHIAHFCQNLDMARVCIRKCMEEGKPAFCGKDHICYCGHKYTSHDKKSAADANEVYKNFQDMYEKYFGKKPSGVDTIVDLDN